MSTAAMLARCSAEIREIQQRPDVVAGTVPAWLVCLGISDWECEMDMIRAREQQETNTMNAPIGGTSVAQAKARNCHTYACSVVGADFERDFIAETVGKAKYQYWRSLRACDLEIAFTDIRARSLGTLEPRKTDYQQRCSDEAARVAEWNATHPVGTPVQYWTFTREGKGKESRTRTTAHLLSGHTAVVWVEGEASCISLTHVEASR